MMAERLLNDQVATQVKQVFEDLKNPVSVLFFGQKENCEYCDETRQLLEEVTALSDKLDMSVHDLQDDASVAAQYNVDKAPGIVLLGQDGKELIDYGIRIYGIPAGHEFSSLIHDLVLVSGQDSQLSKETRDYLKELVEPVHLQVFVTPT